MIHLLGVAHREQASLDLQGTPQTDAQKHYADVLKKTIEGLHPSLVAEEYSTESEKENNRRSIAKPLADACGVKHRFCDPCSDQRKAIKYLGIQELHQQVLMHDKNWNISPEEAETKAWAICIGKYFHRRETFWLKRIREASGPEKDVVVYVLGDGHVESFADLLAKEGIRSEIVERHIGVTAEDDALMQKGLQYLKEHPECVDEF
jgi:hypothetical protein